MNVLTRKNVPTVRPLRCDVKSRHGTASGLQPWIFMHGSVRNTPRDCHGVGIGDPFLHLRTCGCGGMRCRRAQQQQAGPAMSVGAGWLLW